VILDVDGTLVDSNDAHASAWVEALREAGHDVPFERIRRLIGMGGDKLLPTAVGISKDDPAGKQLATRRGEIFKSRYLSSLKPFPGTRALLQRMRADGLQLVVASSAEDDELKALLRIAEADDLIEEQASSDDAKESKPDPDIVQVALDRSGLRPDQVLMIGDTPYDVEAAGKAGAGTIAFRCGGWDDPDLAGARAVYDGPADLLAHYDVSPLAR
jgi:HAD superfamily hydrolase (TIGR01509 family)